MLEVKRNTIILLLLICNLWAYASSVEKLRLLSLLKQTDFYIAAENFEKAAELRDQALVLFKGLGAENDSSTISELHLISHAYSEKKMFSEAIKTESLLVEILPLVMPDNKLEYALYLNDLSLYLLDDNNIVLAEKNIKKALSLIKNEKDVNVATIYFRAAEIYNETTPKRINLSIKYQKKAVDIYANKYGVNSSKYLDELWYLANYYEKAEDYNNACNAYIEIIHTRSSDDNKKDTQKLLSILDRIIFCSRKINNTEQEELYKWLAYNIKKQEQEYHKAKYPIVTFPSIKDSLDYHIITQEISSYREQHGYFDNNETDFMQIYEYYATLPDSYGKAYSMSAETIRNSLMLNWKETIDLGIETLRVFDNLGIITDKYVVVLCCIANAYNELDNPAKAYDYVMKAFNLRDDYLSSDNFFYNGIPRDLATYCSKLGNYRDAIKYGLVAVNAAKALQYSDSPSPYFNSLNNLATYYGAVGDNEAEIKTLRHLIKRAEDIAPYVLDYQDSPYMFNLACCFLRNGDYDKAIEIGLKLKEVRVKYGYKPKISNIYNLLAKSYWGKGQMQKALYHATKSNSILKEIGGDDNLSLSSSYDLLAKIYRDVGNNKEAERYEKNCINLVFNNIVNNFVDLPSYDRTSYWKMYSKHFNIWYPNFYYQAKVEDTTELYNKCALFSKSILLTTETEMSKLIIESGDEKALAKYQQILLRKSLLSKKASEIQTKETISTDSLRAEIDRLERELIKECKVYGDYTANLKITWKDVQAALKPNDVAIEFISFPLMENDSVLNKTLYAALIVRKNDNKPHFVELFEEAELDQLGNNNAYSEELYKLIWEPIDRYLSDNNSIYFSPAGKLYNINIEVLPELFGNNDGRNYYRVSSTRMLAQSNNDNSHTTNEKAIIYGGLNYDATILELIADSKLHTRKESSYRGNVDNLDLRYGWDYLPETLVEVNAIESTMKRNEVHTQVYTDTLGTEASFKSLDGQSCKIIHIATHGFYYTKDDSVKMKSAKLDYLANQMDSYSRSYEEDISLTRSGLLMAGCNNILRGYKLPNDIDDGILFSKEIAGMNLKNVELTVLSSCDSGLGDVTGEGVFGLQRAFKKAGAQSILMSLHKVDDEATRILMVEFYKNLMAGKSKLQSLKDAQHHLRQVENGKYDNPKYWASFIMLDGLN